MTLTVGKKNEESKTKNKKIGERKIVFVFSPISFSLEKNKTKNTKNGIKPNLSQCSQCGTKNLL